MKYMHIENGTRKSLERTVIALGRSIGGFGRPRVSHMSTDHEIQDLSLQA